MLKTTKNEKNPPQASNIRVVVRTRPLAADERGCLVQMLDDQILVFDAADSGAPTAFGSNAFSRPQSQPAPKSKNGKNGQTSKNNRSKSADSRRKGVPSAPLKKTRGRTRHKEHKFAFDFVFDKNSKQEEVYQQTARPLIDKLIEGYNCSCFAYGATGAGKTYTMSGTATKPGIMYRAVTELYTQIRDLVDKKDIDLFVTFCEVYNERIHDLLVEKPGLKDETSENPDKSNIIEQSEVDKKLDGHTPKKSTKTSNLNKKEESDVPKRPDLTILEKNGDIQIQGLSLHKAPKSDILMHLLAFGNKNRTQHATDANATSSRSHAVFTVYVRQRDKTAELKSTYTMSKLVLVDLAGSERAAKVTANRHANRLREGANINKSLLALGSVINALAARSKPGADKKGFVNYRNSKLTRILKDSLGGNCFTVMIANISPADSTYEDTWNTLCYANRAKSIKANVKKSQVSVSASVAHYRDIANKQSDEIKDLKRKLTEAEGKMQEMQECLEEKDLEIEERDVQIEDLVKRSRHSSKKSGVASSREESEEDAGSDTTFVIDPSFNCNTPMSTRKTPVATRSQQQKYEISEAVQDKMDSVMLERKRILRKAFRLCSELRSANLNTVIRTVNTSLKSSNTKKNKQSNDDGFYSPNSIQLQISGAKTLNANAKSDKLGKLDKYLEKNMNSLRNLTMNLQKLMHGGMKFQDGMHPVGLYLDLKTLQLDLDETKAQNGHLKHQIDILFNAWRKLVHVTQTAVSGFHLSHKMLKFNDMVSENVRDKMDGMNRALGNGVGFARVGLEQVRNFETDSDITTGDSENESGEENGELNLSDEDLNRTIIRPSRGISKTFSSLFNLPKINGATENMNTEDWIVDDQLLKKLVFQGLNSYSNNHDCSLMDTEEENEQNDSKIDSKNHENTSKNSSNNTGKNEIKYEIDDETIVLGKQNSSPVKSVLGSSNISPLKNLSLQENFKQLTSPDLNKMNQDTPEKSNETNDNKENISHMSQYTAKESITNETISDHKSSTSYEDETVVLPFATNELIKLPNIARSVHSPDNKKTKY